MSGLTRQTNFTKDSQTGSMYFEIEDFMMRHLSPTVNEALLFRIPSSSIEPSLGIDEYDAVKANSDTMLESSSYADVDDKCEKSELRGRRKKYVKGMLNGKT
ncbi:hypothetical protein C0991_012223 [Blastosporella zonata]|nr:hypothetical protein C0991_012223 [Blastosporella zonata]